MLKRRNQEVNHNQGYLPEEGYLANPFVPFQYENPPKYDARLGMVRGTLFPGLELPFMGMVNKHEKPKTPLTELQALAFAIQELALYLDTHQEDQEALELYQAYQKIYHEAAQQYSKEYAQMSHRVPSEGPYQWVDDPWPWEYAENKEG